MGKKQHQKDKMYLTCTEWSTFYGGKKQKTEFGEKSGFRRLPFSHCALSLQPFEHPLCTPEGIIYDLMNIVPFLKKFGTDPTTGKTLEAKSLTKLNFYKNIDGKYHCPVLYKVFNQNSHIVAIKTTGNVYSYEAVEQLNLKTKFFKDLLVDEPFTRNDIISLQDPSNLDKFNLSNFHHLKNNQKVVAEEELKAMKDPKYTLKSVSAETKDILDELEREHKPSEKVAAAQPKADGSNAAHYSTGAVAAGLTSTVMEPTTSLEPAILAENVVRYRRIKKKGYVQLRTTHGNLNLELCCDQVPKTCENFIKLCENGYYTGTVFHRSIRNFMIQGGDPMGTGKGGESFWGKPFKDEFNVNLVHQGRGILSMANSGPCTNKSQFFITYRSCRHLDGKHTIFGKVVGGLDTLTAMERVEVDAKDKPKKTIKILDAAIFVDPYQEVDEQLKKEREVELKQKREEESSRKRKAPPPAEELKSYRSGVGKYIAPRAIPAQQGSAEATKKKQTISKFGDFSSW